MTLLEYRIITILLVAILGAIIGSFLNVCILRIPAGESLIPGSHCPKCNRHIRPYDNVPIISWLLLRGKCRYCKTKISVQYPIIEGSNAALWVLTFVVLGISLKAVFVCLLLSALLTLSVIDGRTHEIPFGINVFIFILGVLYTVLDYFYYNVSFWNHIIGFFAVSVFLYLIFILTKGQGIGGGDVKLMAAAGLFLGYAGIVQALIYGCFLGAVIHILRMKISKATHVLAMGPYLSAGILIAAWFGEIIFNWYLKLFII